MMMTYYLFLKEKNWTELFMEIRAANHAVTSNFFCMSAVVLPFGDKVENLWSLFEKKAHIVHTGSTWNMSRMKRLEKEKREKERRREYQSKWSNDFLNALSFVCWCTHAIHTTQESVYVRVYAVVFASYVFNHFGHASVFVHTPAR